MDRRVMLTVTLSLLVVMTTGCASRGNRNKITALQSRNAVLTDQLNRGYSDLESAMRERDDFNTRLSSALAEINGLRGQLAQRVEPEPAPPGWTAVPGGAMIAIEGNVLCSPGKVTLRKNARRTLDGIVSIIEGEYVSKDILVFGHTDNRPIKKSGWADNWQLSAERSLAVVRFLRERGVQPSRLVAAGCGEHRSRVPNNSEPNRSANRRVEIFAIDAQAWTGRAP